jgi:hypothetical protein
MKIAIYAALAGSAAAFAPSVSVGSSTSLRMETSPDEAASPFVPTVLPINGWVPNSKEGSYGLPGAISPLGFFDPLGFTKDKSVDEVKRIREAEVMHSRVAMMAVVGYLIGESTPTINYGMDVHHTIANNQIPEIPLYILFPFFLTINIFEALRATRGWVEPGADSLFTLRENYYPGDM